MKNKRNLSELTLDELHTEKNKRQKVTTVLGSMMLLICGLLVFMAVKNKNYTLLPIAIGSLITLMPSLMYLSKVAEEIKKRQKDN